MRAQEFDQGLEEGWRDTLAGLALGGLSVTAGAHVVRPGDTVYSIARANNTTPAAIARANDLGPDYKISTGQRLRIPGARDVLDAQRRAELARLGYTDQAKPPARTPATTKPPSVPAAKAAPAPATKRAEPEKVRPRADIDISRTWTGTRGEALVTQAALRSGIRKRSELAALLAQTAHESNNFRVMGEDLSYSAQGLMKTFPSAFPNARIASQYANRPQAIANRAYANRLGNGSEKSGDGWRYRGRGYIQLTGRENYRRAGRALGLPLERQPDLASDPEVAAKVAVWYWKNRTQPNVRDFYDVRKVTSTINPAQRGARSREENFADFYQWLGNRDQRT
jgi:putative chitinase